MYLLLLLSLLSCCSWASPLSISMECLSGLGSKDKLTLAQMIDATGKPSGIFQGSFTSFGDSIACLAIKAEKQVNYAMVGGALNLTQLGVSSAVGSHLGVCLPRPCLNQPDLQFIFDFAVEQVMQKLPGNFDSADNDEYLINDQEPSFYRMLGSSVFGSVFASGSKNTTRLVRYEVFTVDPIVDSEWTTGAYITISLIAILVVTVLLSTWLHYHAKATVINRYVNERQDAESAEQELIVSQENLENEKDTLLPVHKNANDDSLESRLSKQVNDHSLLYVFSLYNTGSMLFTTKPPRHDELGILNMIRFFSMMWVMFCHSISNIMQDAPVDALDFTRLSHSFAFAPLVMGFISVDSFFFMSTFLVAYMQFNAGNAKKFSYVKYVVLRYLRTTPTLIITLLIWMFLLPLIGGGQAPLWFLRQSLHPEKCYKYWWSTLLYLNNAYPVKLADACMGWTWYLAADFQLYLLIPVFSLPLAILEWRKYTKYVYGIGTLVTLAITLPILEMNNGKFGIVPYENESVRVFKDNFDNWQTYFYTKPYFRFTLLMVSVYGAHWIYTIRQRLQDSVSTVNSFRLKLTAQCYRIAGVVIFFFIVYFPYVNTGGTYSWSLAGHAAFITISRPLYALGLLLFIYPSLILSGYEKVRLSGKYLTSPIEGLLTWKGWAIIARLTYCVYLLHCIVLIVTMGYLQQPMAFTWAQTLMMFGSTVLWSYLFAIPLYVCVEAPVALLVRKLVHSGRPQTRHE